uniref:Late endosomal/lysosomal adaptor and MAPK and MTOR activator 1 n=1 Tax=Anisakis simplex TaxID=6269 RepID=A0A0M3JGZ9_ANISI
LMGRGDEDLKKQKEQSYPQQQQEPFAKQSPICSGHPSPNMESGREATGDQASATHETRPPQGISVDPATLLDMAGWKVPALPPGLMSITHEADRRPYASVLPPSIFEKAMKAAAVVHAGVHLPPLTVNGNGIFTFVIH